MKSSDILRFITILIISLKLNADPFKNPSSTDRNYSRSNQLTNMGNVIEKKANEWAAIQINYPSFAKPSQCSSNINQVFKLSGLTKYKGNSVSQLLDSIINAGGSAIKLPREKRDLIDALNSQYGGKIPVGSVIGGGYYSDYHLGVDGQHHSAIVGSTSEDGIVYVYQNNSHKYSGIKGRARESYISQNYIDKGLERQWMKSPWLKLTRNSEGNITDIKVIDPAVSYLSPFIHHVTLATPKEITDQLVKEVRYQSEAVNNQQ